MAEIKVTTQKLRDTSNDLQAKKDDIARRLDELNELEQRLGAMWEGRAKESFHGAFSQTYNNCKGFLESVKAFIVKLDETAAKYESNEARAAEAASKRV